MGYRRGGRRGALRPAESFSRSLGRYQRELLGPILAVPVYVPRPMAYKVRREIYSYRKPFQRQMVSRVVRRELKRKSVPYTLVKVKVRIPRHLPLVKRSYVSVDRNRINIYSARQVERLLDREFNRRRYSEHKRRRRRASDGQLESRGADRHGLVAEAVRRGGSVDAVADAAMIARALPAFR